MFYNVLQLDISPFWNKYIKRVVAKMLLCDVLFTLNLKTMIKNNEIRVGNWLNWFNEFHCNLYFDKQIEIDDFTQTNLAKAKPILLNEEWLIKFGFIKRNDRLFTLNYFEIHFVNELFYFESYKLIPLLYVHQLQNTYFISEGVELELSSNVA